MVGAGRGASSRGVHAVASDSWGAGRGCMVVGGRQTIFSAPAPPSWIVEVEKKGFGKAIYDTSRPGVFEKDFGGTLPVLVIYTLQDTVEQDKAMVQAYVNAIHRAMAFVKAAPLAEVQALVTPKYFSGIDPDAVGLDAAQVDELLVLVPYWTKDP